MKMGRQQWAVLVLAAAVGVAGCGGGGAGGTGGVGSGGPTGGNPTGGAPTGGGGTAARSYYPPWENATPTRTITLAYDASQSAVQNGAALRAAIAALQPGDRLEIGGGTWSINSFWNVVIQGTESAPIWIVAAAGATPIITRPDAAQNVLNVGSGAGNATRYVCFRGLEFTGGDTLIRLYHCENVWIDQCHIHHGSGVGITANTEDTRYLYITRNHIHDPGGASDTCEGMYLGANNSAVRMSRSIIALNHVHDCRGTQGDGIELKQGSYDNWIVENHVHDTNYPGIIAYGTDGLGTNVIERNIVYNSGDNVLQVQGEAIVRNNLLMNGATGFHSHDHQGQTRNLQVVHNTIINAGPATNLTSWNGRSGMVFANNAVYSRDAGSIRFPGGSTGVTVTGNVVLGPVTGAGGGFVFGNGITDFGDVSWDAARRDGTPSAASALLGGADPSQAATEDIRQQTRTAPVDAGAFEKR